MRNIVLLGDSIRIGYQQTVREQLADHAIAAIADLFSYLFDT